MYYTLLRKRTCDETGFKLFDFSFRNTVPRPSSSSYPNTVSSYVPTHNSLIRNSSRWNTRVALPDQENLATRDMNTGRSPTISAFPSLSPLTVASDLREDLILAGGAKRSFYLPHPKPPTASWSDFRNRHLYQMQQKPRIIPRNHFGLTTSDETTSPSSSTSDGEGSIAETELMIHQNESPERRFFANSSAKPPKPPRAPPTRNDNNTTTNNDSSENSKAHSSKYSSKEIINSRKSSTPAPPPPPMPPIKSFSKNTRHLGHVTGITETLQNRMANAAVVAASEARARKVSKL